MRQKLQAFLRGVAALRYIHAQASEDVREAEMEVLDSIWLELTVSEREYANQLSSKVTRGEIKPRDFYNQMNPPVPVNVVDLVKTFMVDSVHLAGRLVAEANGQRVLIAGREPEHIPVTGLGIHGSALYASKEVIVGAMVAKSLRQGIDLARPQTSSSMITAQSERPMSYTAGAAA